MANFFGTGGGGLDVTISDTAPETKANAIWAEPAVTQQSYDGTNATGITQSGFSLQVGILPHPLAVQNGVLYGYSKGDTDPQIWAVDISTGTFEYKDSLSNYPDTAVLDRSNGTIIYQYGSPATLVAYDSVTQNVRWEKSLSVGCEVMDARDGIVVCRYGDNEAAAFDVTTGTKMWVFTEYEDNLTDDLVFGFFSGSIVSDGVLLSGGLGSNQTAADGVYKVEKSDGSIINSYANGSEFARLVSEIDGNQIFQESTGDWYHWNGGNQTLQTQGPLEFPDVDATRRNPQGRNLIFAEGVEAIQSVDPTGSQIYREDLSSNYNDVYQAVEHNAEVYVGVNDGSNALVTQWEVDGISFEPSTLDSYNLYVSDGSQWTEVRGADGDASSDTVANHDNGSHTQTYIPDGDGIDRKIWVIPNGGSDPQGATSEDLIFEKQ